MYSLKNVPYEPSYLFSHDNHYNYFIIYFKEFSIFAVYKVCASISFYNVDQFFTNAAFTNKHIIEYECFTCK